jgi:Carbohydrate esterase, sialic acid-specific acetylesterase
MARISSRPVSDRQGQIFLSVVDTYENVDLNRGSFNDVRDRRRVELNDVVQGRTAVFLVFGQSNGANSGDTPYVPSRRVFNLNMFDGQCYVAKDPLLGTTERGGNFAGRMADMLIEAGLFDSVVLTPISVGGSRIEEWTTGGARHRRLQVAIKRALDYGLQFTHLLWHQGETNARYDPDGPLYAACFMDIHAALRRYGIHAPVYVAQATVCDSPPNGIIRAAQRAVVDPAAGILAGPDTDTIGFSDRYDNCHMAESGLIKHAKLWIDVLTRESAPPVRRSART